MTEATADVSALPALVQAAQRGNRRAADELIREHEGWVRSVIYGVTGRRDLVDDIAQQVWTRVWQRIGSLEDPRRLKAWLYTVARRVALDAVQQAAHAATVSLEAVACDLNDARYRTPPRAAIGQELHETLLRAVEALPALYREPFVLRHLQDWSYAEIGELLGLSTDTVETRLVRARRMLREMLETRVRI